MHLQVMEHLCNTKASVVELQGVKDLLNSKAGLTDVNAALSQVCCTSFLHSLWHQKAVTHNL